MAYTTDLTKAEFKIIEPLLPKTFIQTRPPKWSKHEILNGIFYQLVNACRWVDLPKDLPLLEILRQLKIQIQLVLKLKAFVTTKKLMELKDIYA